MGKKKDLADAADAGTEVAMDDIVSGRAYGLSLSRLVAPPRASIAIR